MSQRYQSAFGILALFWGAGAARANMIVTGPLQPNGDVGFVSSPSNSIVFGIGCPSGSNCQGSIYQMDGFVNVPNYDFGDGPGMSHQLTNGAPAGIGYTFNASQPTADQLLLTYTFINNTAQALTNFQFLYYADPDIGPDFTDEWATVTGSPGFGLTSYQVGDPTFSSIFTNLDNGTLSNMNEQPATNLGDVSTALGFRLASLNIGGAATFRVMMSDDLSSIGSFILTQRDSVYADNMLTLSGELVVPEPSSLALFGMGILALALLMYRKRRVV